MKRIIFLLVFLASLAAGIFAQETSGTKVIVFKTSGELSIFNTNDLTKIELSRFDKDSVEHQDYVSQVFFRNDTTYSVIPISEIDSVAFGVRNIIEPKPGVRRLTDEEAAAITYFDGEKIRYDDRKITLTEGELVYYDQIAEILPYGLCGRIGTITESDDLKMADFIFLEPSEVFDRFLITGEIESDVKKNNQFHSPCPEITLPEITVDTPSGRARALLKLTTALSLGDNNYIDFVRGNGHASLIFTIEPSLELSAQIIDPDNNRIRQESETGFSLPPFIFLGGALNVNIDFRTFVDLYCEAQLDVEVPLSYTTMIDWNLKKWKSEFGLNHVDNGGMENPQLKAEIQVKGGIFAGGLCDLSLNLPMRAAGAGVLLELGPKLEGEFSMGVIQNLSERYNPEFYAKAHYDFTPLSLKLESYTQITYLVWDEGYRNMRIEHRRTMLPFESEFNMQPISIDLFPDFNSRAVLAKSNSEFVKPADAPEVVSISSYTETELPIPLDIDFEIAAKDTDETIAEVDIEETLKIADEIEETYQNVQGEIPMPEGISDERLENIVARPVINYMGYKVKAAPVNVASDMVFSPVIAVADKGGAYFVSGMTPVSQHRYEDDTYIEGNLVGVLPVDDRFKGKRTFTTIDFVDLSDLTGENGSVNPNHPLIGEWHGVIDDEDVTIHFLDDKTGTFNGKAFTYKFNSPLQGGISILVEDGSTVTFSILNIDDREMTIVPKGVKQRAIILTKS